MTSPQRMTLRKWKRIQKGNLIGVAGIALPFGGTWLDVDDVSVCVTNGKVWAAWPGKPVVKDGQVARLPGSSKLQYVNILHWRDPEIGKRFSVAVIELVRAADPETFDGGMT
jgi:hypothetical protein